MLPLLRGARSLISAVLAGLLYLVGGVVVFFLFLPAARVWPRHRQLLVTIFMKGIVSATFFMLRLGGARARRSGTLPTATPIAIIANHQSLLDILHVTLLAHPRAPAFVTRRRYARFIPSVSTAVRLLGCPIVDPERDSAEAIEAIRRGARELPHGLLIFPEGHRSRDGEVGPFHTAGLRAVLTERRMPVYLVVNEGSWHVRRFVDLLFRVHLIDSRSEVIGPWEMPEDPTQVRAFINGSREAIRERLREMRAESGGV